MHGSPQAAHTGRSGLVLLVSNEVGRISIAGRCADVLDIGAGSRTGREDEIAARTPDFLADRVDVVPCHVDHPRVRKCYTASAEDMPDVRSSAYDVVFANYVLEHVPNLRAAASEIHRVLRPGGLFVATVPNTASPEFIVARHTPMWLHRFFQPGAFETYYSYRSVGELQARFCVAGFDAPQMVFSPVLGRYMLHLGKLAGILGEAWDSSVLALGIQALMGEILLSWRKPATPLTFTPPAHLSAPLDGSRGLG